MPIDGRFNTLFGERITPKRSDSRNEREVTTSVLPALKHEMDIYTRASESSDMSPEDKHDFGHAAKRIQRIEDILKQAGADTENPKTVLANLSIDVDNQKKRVDDVCLKFSRQKPDTVQAYSVLKDELEVEEVKRDLLFEARYTFLRLSGLYN